MKVRDVTDLCVYVELLEYDNHVGIIPLQEMTKRRVSSLHTLTKVGRIEYAYVTHVDESKGIVDLSKRNVTKTDIQEVHQRYTEAKCVQSIVNRVAENLSIPLLELNEQIPWKLYRDNYNPYDFFKKLATNSGENIGPLSDMSDMSDVRSDILECLIQETKKRFKTTPLTIRCEIMVMCNTEHGINGIKNALLAGQEISNDVVIHLISHPRFLVILNTTEPDMGIATVKLVCDSIRDKLCEYGGELSIKSGPSIVSTETDTLET